MVSPSFLTDHPNNEHSVFSQIVAVPLQSRFDPVPGKIIGSPRENSEEATVVSSR